MSYPTGSYLELYTSYFGWVWYDNFVSLLEDTGLWMLPFLITIAKNWHAAETSTNNRAAAIVSLRRNEVDIYVGLLIVVLCFKPIISFAPGDMAYIEASGATITASQGTDTGYQKTFGSAMPATVKVPIFWYLGIQVAQGINAASKALLPSSTDLYRLLQDISAYDITDPRLRAEVNDFYSQCFRPTRARYLRNDFDLGSSGSATKARSAYGNVDSEWMGSHIFLNTAGLYKECQDPPSCGVGSHATHSRSDWSYDWDIPAQTGLPYCDVWWTNATHGLKKKMLDHAGFDWGILSAAWNLGDRTGAEDAAIRRILDNAPPRFINRHINEFDANRNGWQGFSAGETISETFNFLGIALASGTYTLIMDVVVDVLPMVQSLSLFTVIALMPWAIVVSGYSVVTIIEIGLALFSIIFWTTLWNIIYWLNNTLLAAMYGVSGGTERITNFISTGGASWKLNTLLIMVNTGFLILVIKIWVWLLTMAHAKSLAALDSMASQGSEVGENAGRETANVVRR